MAATRSYQGHWPSNAAPRARPQLVGERGFSRIATALAFLAFCLLIFSLRPFDAISAFSGDDGVEGDRLNQIGFAIAGAVALVSLLTLVRRQLLSIFLTPTWLALGFVLVVSIYSANDPNDAIRAVTLTVVGMLVATCIILLPPDERTFQLICAVGISSVLIVCYVGVLLFPYYGIHGGDGLEPQHAGLWRGHFQHKNLAGPVMSVFVMIGIYLWRSGFRWVGPLIVLLSLVFVLNTGSKTTNGFLPLAIAIVLAGRAIGRPQLTVTLFVVLVMMITALTLGTVFSDSLAKLVGFLLDDPTYTGRVTLWEFGFENLTQKLWFGWGFDSFWGTRVIRDMEYPFDAAWDFRGVVHGHNNFLDTVLLMGVVGFLVLTWAFFVSPVINYLKSCQYAGNSRLADLFMMIIVFMTFLSFLEAFLLSRVDPVWICMYLAVIGLQFTARFKVA